jgi:transcriptional regulator with XRE-family HTH domain
MTSTPCPFAVARDRLNLAQTEVADRAGISQRLVSDYDRGHYPRSVVLAAKAAKIVGLTLDEMFPGAADVALDEQPEGVAA